MFTVKYKKIFKPGDLVQLKSGGPIMTVSEVENLFLPDEPQQVTATYFIDRHGPIYEPEFVDPYHKTEDFSADSLVLIKRKRLTVKFFLFFWKPKKVVFEGNSDCVYVKSALFDSPNKGSFIKRIRHVFLPSKAKKTYLENLSQDAILKNRSEIYSSNDRFR